MTIFQVYTDASSRYKAVIKDEGKKVYLSSVGAVIKDGHEIVGTISKRVGFQDSNYAEFLAMYKACEYLIHKGVTKVDFHVDNINLVLMVNQGIISKKPKLQKMQHRILDCLTQFDHCTVTWIPRRENHEAHMMAANAFRVG